LFKKCNGDKKQLIKIKRRKLSSIGAFWLCGDRNRTNFYKIYGRFKEIGLLHVMFVFRWLYDFGLDVLLGIDRKLLELIPTRLFFLFKKW